MCIICEVHCFSGVKLHRNILIIECPHFKGVLSEEFCFFVKIFLMLSVVQDSAGTRPSPASMESSLLPGNQRL